MASEKPNDLDLHRLSLSMWICVNNLDQVKIKNGRDILIYSALQGL